MTSQSSSIDKRNAAASKNTRRYGFLALLENTLRRSWTTGLLISIIMFFIFPVVVFAGISISIENYGSHETLSLTEVLRFEMISWSELMRPVMIPVLSILAVVMACIMLRYLHNRVAVDFYHSLPIRRERLLGVNLTAGYLLLLVPFILMSAVSVLIIAVNGAFSVELLTNLWIMLAEAVSYSLIFYALTALVGVVSGLTSVQLLLSAVAIFIIPALYVTFIEFINIFNTNMWTSWYTSEELTSLLSPVVDFFWNSYDLLRPDQYVAYILAAAGLLALTFFAYRRYRSERAGNSVIFPSIGSVVKYSVMLLATMLLGMLFYMMMENRAWLIFGMICGAVLTFMLSNTIINKSAKAMFLGIKGLAVFMGSVAVVMTVLMTNLFGINTDVPSSLSKVVVSFDSLTGPITFRDDAAIEALRTLYEQGKRKMINYGYGYIGGEDSKYAYYSNDDHTLGMVFYPTVGLPIAKQFTVTNTSDFADELRIILDSAEFKAGYIETIESIKDESYEDYIWRYQGLQVRFDGGKAHSVNSYALEQVSSIGYESLKAALLADAANIGYDSFQTQTLGYFTLNTTEGYRDINVAFGMDATYELLMDAGVLNVHADELLDNYARSVESIKVIHIPTGASAVYTSASEIREIIGSLESLVLEHWNRCELTVKDRDYAVIYDFNYSDGAQSNATERESAFLYGRVPEFVSADFAS